MEDIVFSDLGTDLSYTSMDLYRYSEVQSAPTLVFVHGGGWVSGDKSKVLMSEALVDYFVERGWAFAAVNYRLQNNPAMPGIRYSDQVTDVASAIGYLRDNATELGVDPQRLILMGFSAGAHLVALVGADPRYLAVQDLVPTALRGIISLDVSAYDIPRAIEEACAQGFCDATINLPGVFGSDKQVQRDASPLLHLGEGLPPFLVVSASSLNGVRHTLSKSQSEYFVDAVNFTGGKAKHLHVDKPHPALVLDFGADEDALTLEVAEFLEHK